MTLKELLNVTELPDMNVEILDYYLLEEDETCKKLSNFKWISKYLSEDIYNNLKYPDKEVKFFSIFNDSNNLNRFVIFIDSKNKG